MGARVRWRECAGAGCCVDNEQVFFQIMLWECVVLYVCGGENMWKIILLMLCKKLYQRIMEKVNINVIKWKDNLIVLKRNTIFKFIRNKFKVHSIF